MSILIAVPCMDTVPVPFMSALLYLEKTADTSIVLESGSLVYDSRNILLNKALRAGVDRILWLDSDMTFEPDAMMRLSADLDQGCEIVSGLFFKRRPPFEPVIYKECGIRDIDGGLKEPYSEVYLDYPDNELFEIGAVGFGVVMMTMDAVRKITEAFGPYPFMPVAGFGEDMSFCIRAQRAGVKMHCDSRVKCGHIGYYEFNEAFFNERRA